MLMMSAEIIFPQITDMSLEDTVTWLHRLCILLPHVNVTVLELLPLSMPCPWYQAFIAAIDGVYPALSARKKHDVYEFQKAYLTAQFTDSEILKAHPITVYQADTQSFCKGVILIKKTLVRDAILRTVLLKLRHELQNFSSESWATWFQQQLPLLLPGMNKTYLGWLGTNISCDSYQAIVKGFNFACKSLLPSNKIDIYNSYIKTYLSQQSHSTGIACDIERGMRNWIDVNLWKFIRQSSTQDLVCFNAKFKKLSAQSLKDLLGPNFGFHLEAGYSQQPSADDFHSFPWESTPLVKHFQMGLWESYQEVERLFQTLEQIIVSVDNLCGFRTD